MKVIFSKKIVGCFGDSVQDICDFVLHQYGEELVAALSAATGLTPECLVEYEGGIDEWFGPGSVQLYELLLPIRVTYGPKDDTLLEVLSARQSSKPSRAKIESRYDDGGYAD